MSECSTIDKTPSYTDLIRFFVPLALQSASQSFTYPLVAMVASRGSGGTLNLAGLAQANSIGFLLGTLGAGLCTTGMVYARTRGGMSRFWRLNLMLGAGVVLLQGILCIP